MKITDVKPFVVYAPERGRNFTFVKIYADEGLTGLGEAGINGKEESVSGLVETYRRVLVGMDPSRIEHIWQTPGEASSSGWAHPRRHGCRDRHRVVGFARKGARRAGLRPARRQDA